MADHIAWLEGQVNKARKELDGLTAKMQELEGEYGDVQNRLRVWAEALQTARGESGKEGTSVQLELPPHRRKATIADLAEEILRDVGPQGSGELAELLAQKGKRTSQNTVTVTMNRWRPVRFDRNSKNKWYVKVRDDKK